MKQIKLTEDQEKLKEQLAKEVYNVCVLGGTETPFSGELLNEKREGTFKCAVCENELFSSTTKFDSGTGWPSFYDVIESGKIKEKPDNRYGMERIEVLCSNCGAHLGHVFDYQINHNQMKNFRHYCINSVALKFQPK